MIPSLHDPVWAFDLAWAPDPSAGRRLLELPAATPDATVIEAMWQAAGATEADPRPVLPWVQCRVLSVAVVQRRVRDGKTDVKLLWMPRDPADPAARAESAILGTFLAEVGRRRPQLVGFHSRTIGLPILFQRGLVLGLSAPGFCEQSAKFRQGPDACAPGKPMHVDLVEALRPRGSRETVSLRELCVLSGIPGMMKARKASADANGLDDPWREIVQSKCFDALSIYLLWLRMCHFAGYFTTAHYEEEQENVREMLMTQAETPDGAFLEAYFDAWEEAQQTPVADQGASGF